MAQLAGVLSHFTLSVFSLQILHKKNPDKIKIEKAEAQR